MGVIGRNGAGKTTLLRILSRITQPSSGHAVIRGRVGSLLEVGTGFHPELTGRENIYLNGGILGMKRTEIDRKLDEIIDFSGVEAFIETPVKRYSSGMRVRLAFSVAAHLEPEILLVDEVLAVGDIPFQRKCIGKIGEVTRAGRTVLFVSHNMAAIESLCSRCVLLSGGRIAALGPTHEVVEAYFIEATDGAVDDPGEGCLSVRRGVLEAGSSDRFAVTGIHVSGGGGEAATLARSGAPLRLAIAFSAAAAFDHVAFIVRLRTRSGVELLRLSTEPISGYAIDRLEGEGEIVLEIDSLPLTADTYVVDVAFGHPFGEVVADYREVGLLTVSASPVYASGIRLDSSRGYLVVPHSWQLRMAP
jgi:lipopolysaccharide transport system ATP-binding protein